ncbi:Eds1p SKDI_02G1360 [Saccharomyces kudriavzevii IFO 1802]|uniref:EDS1-like protein n=2 Tax=Saccharomyces kudriavzevii (strain ATCC MYA-4449 / AS 2.2408 / CBS 8840 / NBRC 1802 / NCYC 2889) TaxID=226230 RepID=J6EHS8_SACK1|nr:uncharacterized protein SKDI_02G1360 [Saccharomyces kudriavzevii IFO 1802]EJT43494.1 EDS1-like protein [Saccharomyces kudriavzevii IFO 1802]CAI4055254.1 hypothetical protein SKDI_02G1360 [Saccharomyces kudriavzevii IFO 1802]
MSQQLPNLYGTTTPSPYKVSNIVAPIAEKNWSETSRDCEADCEKTTKQRKKASRACDQCRKKRIKCRFNQHTRVCQGCLEVGGHCLFLRVPLKRGPAKKKTTGTSNERSSSDNGPLDCRLRTHSYPMNLGNNQLSSFARNFSFPSINSLFVPSMATQSQQFWKVPYDDIRRKNSLATLHNHSPISTGFGENYRPGQNSGVVEEGKSIGMRGTMTPVEGKGGYSSSAGCPGSQSPQFQERRDNPYLDPFTSRSTRSSSISYASDAIISEGSSHDKEQYMLTPNSVHFIEKERLNSLTAGHNCKRLDTGDNAGRCEHNPTWKPVPESRDHSYSTSEEKDLLNRDVTLNPPIFSTKIQPDEISFLKVIDIYYNFFHINFPIIPIGKNKFTDMFTSMKPPVVHEILKINNETIQHFKTALEILIFCKIKQSKSSSSWSRDHSCSFQKGLYYTENFRKCINDCFLGLMAIKSKLRQNSRVIPSRIKFIYFSVIIVLNFILVLTGDETPSLLGPSVAVFNEFQFHRLFLPFGNALSMPLLNANENDENDQLDYGLLLKRLYILLYIMDSLQSFRLGQPKLITFDFGSPIDTFFSDKTGHDEFVEQNPTVLNNILQYLKLGEFMTCFVLNRKSLQINSSQNSLAKDQTFCQAIKLENDESDNITSKFQNLLRKKESLINELLAIGQGAQLLESRCNSNSEMNGATEIVCTMINLVSGILDLIVTANPDNSIDLNLRDLSNTYFTTNKEEGLMSPTQYNTSSLVEGEHEYDERKRLRGTVSVFMLPMVEECFNIIHSIGSIPTTLISLYIRNGNRNKTTEMNAKIMMLSTALNELVQITTLFNKLVPFKQKIHVSAKRTNDGIANSTGCFKSVMKELYLGNHETSKYTNVALPDEEGKKMLSKFGDIGWKLMDDSELGCCCRFTN